MAHVHLMLMNSNKIPHLNLGVQLVGSWCVHSNGLHSCQNLRTLDLSTMSNQVGKSLKVGFPRLGSTIHIGSTIHNFHHPNHLLHCHVVEMQAHI